MQAFADGVLALAWAVVLAHNAFHTPPREWRRWIGGAALVLVVLAAGHALERASGGPFRPPAALAYLGVALALVGARLHVQARGVLGSAWSSAPAPSSPTLVVEGPYAAVRHPLYAALALLALGTSLAHPSFATIAGAIGLLAGLAMKSRREDRALAQAHGGAWEAYRARVPGIVPRLTRRDRRR